MSESMRASSAPSSSRPEQALDTRVAKLNFHVPVESRKTKLPPVNNQIIPDELLVSLTSTVCNRSTLGHTAHHRHCKGCGIGRPDAVWHHPLGRKKYKYFLEQPTSLNGAGRDISFLCDAMLTQRKITPLPPLTDRSGIGDTQNLSVSENLIPEEYHIVKNKGLRSLEFYEDAFTVQLQDDEQKLRVFPSLKPSGRLEVVQLMRMMDDMLVKAGVDQQSEELTELSQMEGLLELVQVEQNIYNIVFHELIRQVSVSCAERGQLLAKLRQRYQSLLERIPHRLKALHTEAVAQRALDRRLTEEIHRIKTSIQQLSTELSRIRDHDALVSQQTEHAHQQLAGALDQTHTNTDVVQGYHELYELQRGRLEAQLLQMTEERDYWSQLTFCLALKVISVKKLQPISRLHISEESWSKTAEHCRLYVASKDIEDLNIIMELSVYWKEQLTAFMSQLKKTEHAQCEQISAIQQGITKWLTFCSTQNKCPDPKYEKVSLEKIHADLKQWSNSLALQCERYQGEKLLCCQQTLAELHCVQERWLNMSLELFRRHPSPDGELPAGQQALRELDRVLAELLKQLDTQVSGESGIHGQITSLLGLMESWVFKLCAVIGSPEMMPVSDWLKLEKALCNWQSLAEEALQNFSSMQRENEKDKNKADIYTETEQVLDKVQEFITSLSNFTDGENQRLGEEVSSIHVAQTRWILDLLLLMVPDHSEDQNQKQEHHYILNISIQTLDEDAKMLAEKRDYFSRYITSTCKLILEEQILQNPREVEGEKEMDECRKLQRECIDCVETCIILLSGVKGGPVELPVRHADPASSWDVPVSPADSMETVVNKEVSAEPTADSEVKDETEAEPRECTAEGHETRQEGELMVCDSPVVKLIGYDGDITQRKLGESRVHLNGTEELVVSPVTDKAHKAFSDLTTVGLLQQELHDSELRVQSAEQRALKAEEALQAALENIQNLERQLQGRPSLEPKSSEEKKKTPPPSPPPVTPPALPQKTTAEAKPTSSTKRTKKR
ncbi:axonemal dynein light chain domain-containing protein 1 isoform X2 [Siniperca chuatsi]|uniref:axonemal dynein light chain domain-containing protein 1 isoform X2 n=1 Tax=Siniperca chuatsi TaxID=119488 RepID=UPI001CE1EF0D|nr:axonemal dynein light chain domain-containing protein 1 isoform X2 [Siniperca chuatsi]